MFVLRIIPGVLWLDVLDRITDRCHASPLFGVNGWRWPCSLTVLVVWMWFLGELRMQAVHAVHYLTIHYYRPHKTQIRHLYGQWPLRLALWGLVSGISYYCTFYFAADFPHLQHWKEHYLYNQHYQQRVTAVYQDDRHNHLMAHIFAQRLLQQLEAVVWILSTLLRLHRKRFFWLLALLWIVRPCGSLLLRWCGNFALWLLLGHFLMRAFDLTPAQYPASMGALGCYGAVVVSSLYWRKFGTLEILVTTTVAVSVELAWQRHLANVQAKQRHCQQEGRKLGIIDRLWAFVVSKCFTADDYCDEKDNNPPTSTSNDVTPAVVVVEYTKPPLYAWLAMVVYWAAVGIKLDGYDLFTL